MIVRPLQAAAALLTSVLCLALAACKSTKKGDEIVDYTSPDTGLSPSEYPFDADGNYREDWASGGTARDVASNTVEDIYSDPVKTEDKPKRSAGTAAAVTGASAGTVAAVAPKPKTTSTSSARSSSEAKPKVTSSSSSRTRPSSSSSRSGSSTKPKTSTAKTSTKAKPKPKPVAKTKPKPAPPKPKPTYVKVQQGDTLSSISRRTGVPVSSLKSYNGMKSDFLRAGQTLTVPPRKR